MSKHIVWTSNINLEDWEDLFEEDGITDESEKYEIAQDHNQFYLEDERDNFKYSNKKVSNTIVVIADLGLWNGRRDGYKFVDNLEDTLYDGDCEICEWYVDDEDFKFSGAHHDGRNHYTYRMLKDGVDKSEWEDKFLELSGTDGIQEYIEKTTQSLKPIIDSIYGW